MPIRTFNHTKLMLIEHVRIAQDTMSIVPMQSSYVYDASQTSYAKTKQLKLADPLPATFVTSFNQQTYYAFLQQVDFENLTGDLLHFLIFADGFKNGIEDPLLFCIELDSLNSLRYSNFTLFWKQPFLRW